MDGDGKCLADTIQCAHCGMHWVANPQVWPNFCTRCGQVVCWKKECREHVHHEKKLDLYEKGKIQELK